MKKIKIILSMMLVSVFTLTSLIKVNALETSELESGVYELQNDIYHESEVGIAMARSYTKEIMKIEKSKEGIYFTISFTGTDYMEDYRIFLDGTQIEHEVVDENSEDKSISLRFKADNLQQKIEAKIYVGPMGRDVEFEIIPKTDTLNLIEKIEEPEEIEENVEQETNVSDISESSNNNTALIIIGVVAVVIVAIFLSIKAKK